MPSVNRSGGPVVGDGTLRVRVLPMCSALRCMACAAACFASAQTIWSARALLRTLTWGWCAYRSTYLFVWFRDHSPCVLRSGAAGWTESRLGAVAKWARACPVLIAWGWPIDTGLGRGYAPAMLGTTGWGVTPGGMPSLDSLSGPIAGEGAGARRVGMLPGAACSACVRLASYLYGPVWSSGSPRGARSGRWPGVAAHIAETLWPLRCLRGALRVLSH